MGHALTGFMHVTDRLRFVFGPATRLDTDLPVIHKHDEYEQASDEDLSHFVVATDSEGHHYAVRREELDKQG
ncbi:MULTISPECIES: hypothetical protein [unclassified Arthrobacter]|uniref:hypothetical protein n=1 Tax=unclassified Pseudarthrobacter TaxID=2647000 RepID=UPI003399C28C